MYISIAIVHFIYTSLTLITDKTFAATNTNYRGGGQQFDIEDEVETTTTSPTTSTPSQSSTTTTKLFPWTQPAAPVLSVMTPTISPDIQSSTEPMNYTVVKDELYSYFTYDDGNAGADNSSSVNDTDTRLDFEDLNFQNGNSSIAENDTEVHLDDSMIYNSDGDCTDCPIQRLLHYAGRSALIVTAVCVTAVSLIVVCSVYQRIMQLQIFP